MTTMIDELVARLRAYSASLEALRVGVSLDESQRLANVTPALSAKAMSEAASLLLAMKEALVECHKWFAENACQPDMMAMIDATLAQGVPVSGGEGQ
jgi:hypothetical protein